MKDKRRIEEFTADKAQLLKDLDAVLAEKHTFGILSNEWRRCKDIENNLRRKIANADTKILNLTLRRPAYGFGTVIEKGTTRYD